MSIPKRFSSLCVRLLCSLLLLASIPTFTVAQDSVSSTLDCSAYPDSVAAVVSDPNVCGCEECECLTCSYCGDGLVLLDEECDDANNVLTDSCRADCRLPYCGDGVWTQEIDLPKGETCDYNDPQTKTACRQDCTKCGDNDVNNPLEECDGTDTPAGMTCRENCKVVICGDGFVDETNKENCDYGIQVGQTGYVPNCRTNGFKCTYCGDGEIQPGVEECDLTDLGGVTHPNASCSSDCNIDPYCGDGELSEDEICEGTNFGNYTNPNNIPVEALVCTPNCDVHVKPYCGDKIAQPELCVDNFDDNWGYCTEGEECDGVDFELFYERNPDKANIPQDALVCTVDCDVIVEEYCGDGVVNEGEICDGTDFSGYANPNNVPLRNLTCSTTCEVTVQPYCGDGVLNTELEEQCDLGANNGAPDLGCSITCEIPPYCGDGILNTELEEQCDLGANNGAPDSGCSITCVIPPYCGDGVLNTELEEQCDLGERNGVVGSGCSQTCGNEDFCENVPVPTQVDRGRYRYNDYCDPKKIVCVKGDGVDSAFNFTNYQGIADLFYNNTNLNQGVTRVDVDGNVILTDANGGVTNYKGTKLAADPKACWTCACNRGSDGCFPPGTKVTLANNQEVLVENVKVGDHLLGAAGQKLEVLKVVEGPETTALVQLVYGAEKIKISQKHVVLTKAGLKRAIDVKSGDQVKKANGTWVAVDSQELLPVAVGQNVINFTLSETSVSEVENHLLVSEGIYTGDLVLQTEFDKLQK